MFFPNPVACLDDILENQTQQFLVFFFVFSRLLSSTLVPTHHQTVIAQCPKLPLVAADQLVVYPGVFMNFKRSSVSMNR